MIEVRGEDQLLARVQRWERERGDRVYMVQPWNGGRVREITWKQTLDEARRMAQHLKSRGFAPGSRIAIIAKNTAHFIIADLAIWMAGHVSVALYPTLTAESVRFILEHSGSELLFVGKLDGWEAMKAGVPAELPRIALPLSPDRDAEQWDDVIAKSERLDGEITRDENDTAIIMYTSGSTGRPKGVEHSFRTLSVAPIGYADVIPIGREGERVLSYLPLAHAYERAGVEAITLYYGTACVYFVESLDTFLKDLARARPTAFHSVPRLWMKFRDGVSGKLPPKRLARLLKVPFLGRYLKKKIMRTLGLDAAEYAVTGSAPLPKEVIEWYGALGLELLEGYAMTENFSYSHVTRRGAGLAGKVGTPLPDVIARIAEDGEIQVKSPATMKGYFREPELTKEMFTDDGYLKTGDRGEIDAKGCLKITGRTKELFKTSKGKFVAPAPIENLLNATGFVEQSCVMGGVSLEQPIAVVMLSAEARDKKRDEIVMRLTALREEVNAKLNPFERLKALAVADGEWTIDGGLLTPTMKIKRDAIEQRYAAVVGRAAESTSRVIWESESESR